LEKKREIIEIKSNTIEITKEITEGKIIITDMKDNTKGMIDRSSQMIIVDNGIMREIIIANKTIEINMTDKARLRIEIIEKKSMTNMNIRINNK